MRQRQSVAVRDSQPDRQAGRQTDTQKHKQKEPWTKSNRDRQKEVGIMNSETQGTKR